MLRTLLLAAGLLACCAVAGADTPKERADALILKGVAAAEKGDYAEAIARFKEAERLYPRPEHHCNLGLAYARWSRPARAYAYLGECQSRAGAKPAWLADRLKSTLALLQKGRFAPVQVFTRPERATVHVGPAFADDERFGAPVTLWLPYGEHTVTARVEGYEAATRRVEVSSRKAIRIDLRLERSTGDPKVAEKRARPPRRLEIAPRLSIGGAFGFGGEAEQEVTFSAASVSTSSASSDLEPTPGVALRFAWPVLRYLSVGAEVRARFAKSDEMDRLGLDADEIIEIAPLISGRIPLLEGRLVLYAAFMVGLTIHLRGSDWEGYYEDVGRSSGAFSQPSASLDTGLGYNLSLVFGAQYFFGSTFGVFLDLGWYHVSTTTEGSVEETDPFFAASRIDIEDSVAADQFALNLGVVFAF